jgi:hypothetical protein
MPARKPTVLIAVLVLTVLAGCAGIGTGATADSPSPTVMPTSTVMPTPTATPTPAATPSPVATPTPEPVSAAQVLAVARHFWWGGSPNYCPYLDCPITPRLATRMAELIKIQSGYPTGGGDLWCRCQNGGPPTVTAEVTPGGGTANVDFGWGKMDFLMVVQGGKLLVDDTQCAGVGTSSSIYAPQLVSCS